MPTTTGPAAPAAAPAFLPSPDPALPLESAPARRIAPTAGDTPGASWWPWLAALVAALLGAGFLWWRRQQSGARGYAAARGSNVDNLGAAPIPEPQPAPLPRQATPEAPPTPRASTPPPPPPVAPNPEGIVTSRLGSAPPQGFVTSRLPAEPAAGVVTSRLASRPDGIFAAGLKPKIEVELMPISVEADASQGAVLTVEIVVTNSGSAPARDVLVEARLINAGAQSDAEVGQFFARAAGPGERVAMIPPMANMRFRTTLAATAEQLAPLIVEGRKLLVPLVAISAFYHGSGADLKSSSSFLVGRGGDDGGKMAPFRLDLGRRRWSDLAVRLHSEGLAS